MDFVLAGDVGGTKTIVGLYSIGTNGLELIREKSVASQDYPGPEPIIAQLLDGTEAKPKTACLGIAGPILNQSVKVPNLPWKVSAKELTAETGIGIIELVNDLVAMSYGLLVLKESDLYDLNPDGTMHTGNKVVLAPGTGLGQSILVWTGHCYIPSPSEAGHGDFAPINDEQLELLKFLWQEMDHVSYDQVGCGRGLVNIYRFLSETGQYQTEDWLLEKLKTDDPAAVISEASLAGESPVCIKALDMMIDTIAAECGNMALRGMAVGGVYLGGGIPPKILPALSKRRFMDVFCNKGRMSDLLKSIPVKVILNPKTPLLGAADRAMTLAKAS